MLSPIAALAALAWTAGAQIVPLRLPPAALSGSADPAWSETLDRLFAGVEPLPALDFALEPGLAAAPSSPREKSHQGLREARAWRTGRLVRLEQLRDSTAAVPPYGGRTRRKLVLPLREEADLVWSMGSKNALALEDSAAALIEEGHGVWAAFRRLFSGPFREALSILEHLAALQRSVEERSERAEAMLTRAQGLPEEGERALAVTERALTEFERPEGPEPMRREAAAVRAALERSKPIGAKDPLWAVDRAEQLNVRIAALDAKSIAYGRLDQRRGKLEKAARESRAKVGTVRKASAKAAALDESRIDLSGVEPLFEAAAKATAEARDALEAFDFEGAGKLFEAADQRAAELSARIEAALRAAERREQDASKFELERKRLEALATERSLALQQLSELFDAAALEPASASLEEARQALLSASAQAKEAEERFGLGRPLGFLDGLASARAELAAASAALQSVSDSAAKVEAADKANAAAIEELAARFREAEKLSGLEGVADWIEAARAVLAAAPRNPADAEAPLSKARAALDAAARAESDRGLLRGLEVAARILDATTSGYGNIDYWIHHFEVRRDMANAIAGALSGLAPKLNDEKLRAGLHDLARELASAPQTGRGDLHYWARMATTLDQAYGSVARGLDRLRAQAGEAAAVIRGAYESGLAQALEPAARALAHRTNGHGHAEYWMHHFEVRRSAGDAASAGLRRAAAYASGDLKTRLESAAAALDNAPRHGQGDAHYWSAMSAKQDAAFQIPADAMLALKSRP